MPQRDRGDRSAARRRRRERSDEPDSPRAKLVFVDDETDLLSSLRASLRRERSRWDMRFFSDPADALAALVTEPADLVVSDMQMPGIDGAEFLRRVARDLPSSIRLVLSGQADESTTLRAAPYAHQWLAKPIARDHLVEVLRGVLAIRERIERGSAYEIVTGVGRLPVLPRVFQELTLALTDLEVSIDEVASIVERDPSAAARALQMANSAFFGLPRPMDDIREAVTFLGFSTLAQLVFAAELLDDFGVERELLEPFVARSVAVSQVASALAPDGAQRHTATTAGLLHEIGRLVLLEVPEGHREYASAIREGDAAVLVQKERELFGANHAEVGAALLAVWGLPQNLVDAVALHTGAPSFPRGCLDVAGMVGRAHEIVLRVEAELSGRPTPVDPSELIERVGGVHALRRLEDIARSVLSGSNDSRSAA